MAENNKLLEAIIALSQSDTAQTRRGLYEELLMAQLLVPQPDGAPELDLDERGKTRKPVEMSLGLRKNDNDEMTLDAFTDEGLLAVSYGEGCAYLSLDASALFKEIAKNEEVEVLAVNPNGPVGGEMGRSEIVSLSQGILPEFIDDDESVTLQSESEILIGQPAVAPDKDLVKLITKAVKSHKKIKTGYLFQMKVNEEEPHLALGIEVLEGFKEEDFRKLATELSKSAPPYLPDGEYLDILPLEGEMLSHVQEMIKPLKTKK